MTIDQILDKLENVKGNDNQYTALCPAHEDQHNSLSVGIGDKEQILLHCHAGCSVQDIVSKLNITMGDLNAQRIPAPKKHKRPRGTKPEAEYLYYDLAGNVVHKTIRNGKQYEPAFSQARPDPANPGRWIYNLKDITPILYQLPQVKEAMEKQSPVYIVEGEKDCDNLLAMGIVATTNPMGAGKWRPHYTEHLVDAICYIIPDNDETGKRHAEQVAKSLWKKAKSIKILDLKKINPAVAPKGDISDLINEMGKEAVHKKLMELVQVTPEWEIAINDLELLNSDEELNELYKGTGYYIQDGDLWHWEGEKDGKMLANFVPIPMESIIKNDGVNTERFFKVCAKAKGKMLPAVMVSSKDFNSMSWVTNAWGFDANFSPGSLVKEYVRHAVTGVGGERAMKKTIYTHTGWQNVNGVYFYLHDDGAIGADDINVELEEGLHNYIMPSQPGEYKAALQSSLSLMDVGPIKITLPLLAFTYLCPLNHFLKQAGHEPATILYLLGITGAMKSTLAALFLCHFGKFTGKTLPGSFKDTANALEKKGFILKDSLMVIDDYHPTAQKAQGATMERTAQQITRSYGDRTGRGRMNSDTNLKTTYVPRGNLIITGEDVPNIGQSGLARHLILELKKGEINKSRLSNLQGNTGQLIHAMRGYIEWLIPQAKDLPEILKEKFERHRGNVCNESQHARMAETVAWLQIGYEMLLDYAVSLSVIDRNAAIDKKEQSLAIFMELAADQSDRIENDRPTAIFINALRELIDSGKCQLLEFKNSKWLKGPGFLGYFDEAYYYLMGDVAYKEVYQFCLQQGKNFPVSKEILLKQLENENAILVEIKNGKVFRTKAKKIDGKTTKFIWLKRTALDIKEDSETSKNILYSNVRNVTL